MEAERTKKIIIWAISVAGGVLLIMTVVLLLVYLPAQKTTTVSSISSTADTPPVEDTQPASAPPAESSNFKVKQVTVQKYEHQMTHDEIDTLIHTNLLAISHNCKILEEANFAPDRKHLKTTTESYFKTLDEYHDVHNYLSKRDSETYNEHLTLCRPRLVA
jgi:hypothetical protein